MGTEVKVSSAGNKGENVRSDCWVEIKTKNQGGIKIELKSKVDALYGQSIVEECRKELIYFGINNAEVCIEDSGALLFVLQARVEAAIKGLITTEKEYLPEFISVNKYTGVRERFRFSRLYLPGNNPKLMINAGIHRPYGVILDLEDSVAPDKKHEARILVRNALRQINFYGAERMVRINQLPAGILDLKYIVPHNVHVILIPKCERAEDIKDLEQEVKSLKKRYDIREEIYYMPIIESALGVERAFEIACSSKDIVAMAIGLEDFTADLGVKRTKEGQESLYARMRIVNACKAAGIQPIDSVFSDVDDIDGLRNSVSESKALGFEGVGCIHPRQIKVVHEVFAPDEEEIEKAKKIVLAYIDARNKGLGVVALGSKMIDPPVVKRAQKIIDLAVTLGIIGQDWYADK